MGEPIPVAFGVHSYQTAARQFSYQRTLNSFADVDEGDARSNVMVRQSEGLKSFASAGSGPIRGGFYSEALSLGFVQSGDTLYSIASDGTTTSIGTTDGGGNPVIFVDGDDEIALLAKTTVWTYDGTTLQPVSDPDFLGASSMDVLDRFLIYAKNNDKQLNLSEQGDFTSYDALRFGTAVRTAGPIVRVKTLGPQFYVFKDDVTEIFFNAGLDTFPFQRRNDQVPLHGCAAKYSVVELDSTLYWLGEDMVVYRFNGATPERISQAGIEKQIRDIAAGQSVTNAIGLSWTGDGHKFYGLTFPTASRTFVFDAKTRMWHERESKNLGRWRPNVIFRAFNKWLAGDCESGNIYELDFATYQDAGENVPREIIGAPVQARPQELTVDRLEVTFETGVGPEDGTEPLVTLNVSKDGGFSWGHDITASLGKVGERRTRAAFHQLGQGKEFMFKLRASYNGPWNVLEAFIHGEANPV